MATGSDEDEGVDYMSMNILEPQKKNESSVQRRARLKREAEIRAHPKSKNEQAAEGIRLREDGLQTQMDRSSKGFKLLSKLGYKPGTALGAGNYSSMNARLEPVAIEVKEDRSGIGHDTERKRKLRQQIQSDIKRLKTDENDFRQRALDERASQRSEHLWHNAMSTLERLEEDSSSSENHQSLDEHGEMRTNNTHARKGDESLKNVNILYRSLVRDRAVAESNRRSKIGLDLDSVTIKGQDSTLMGGVDGRFMWQRDDDPFVEDLELTQYEMLKPEQRLEKVVSFLRDKYFYCFWCKAGYTTPEMQGCPGKSEDDHD